jgi:hypothetical protein
MASLAATSALLFGSLFGAHSTSYSPCSSGTIMADGTHVRIGSAASNRHPLGTQITLTQPGPGGLRHWTIRDRIGWGSELDFWQPSCSGAVTWGRRYVTYRIGWKLPLRSRLTSRVHRGLGHMHY